MATSAIAAAMPSVTLAALGNLDYARALGKKSTESDVQLVSFKEGDTTVSMVVPFRHPEKVAPILRPRPGEVNDRRAVARQGARGSGPAGARAVAGTSAAALASTARARRRRSASGHWR